MEKQDQDFKVLFDQNTFQKQTKYNKVQVKEGTEVKCRKSSSVPNVRRGVLSTADCGPVFFLLLLTCSLSQGSLSEVDQTYKFMETLNKFSKTIRNIILKHKTIGW